jgi:hypothetical protein
MEILAITAQVAATFLGFTGVIFAVGRFSSGSWSVADRHALVNLIIPSLIVLFLSFIPLIVSTAIETPLTVWRISNAVLFVVHAPLVTRVLWLSVKSQLIEPVPMRFVGLPIGFITVLANAAVVLGFLKRYAVTAFVSGLVWLLVIAAIQFALLVMPARAATASTDTDRAS